MGLKGSKSDTQGKPKPTVFQFCRSLKESKFPHVSKLEVVWLPNQWPNYTLDTEDFRLRISEDSPLFTGFRDLFEQFLKEGVPLQITVFGSDGDFEIDRIPDKQCTWEKISTTGYKQTKLQKLWKPKESKELTKE
jgi:hypothetical protein